MIYAFADVTLDLARRELRRGGALAPVEPQVFDLIVFLVERRDRVVSRDEVFEAVWNGRFVSDAALSSRLRDARRALGDDGRTQRIVRTLPGRGLRFVAEARAADAPAAGALAARAEALVDAVMARPAVAVLPFEDEGTGQPWLADGLTDETIAALCAWRSFPVIARHTVFHHRGVCAPAPELGRLLGARYLLAGRLAREGGRVRLAATLTDAEADRELWAGRIVRPVGAAFALEEALAREVVARIEPEMADAEARRVRRAPPEDLTAWELAMRAAWHARRGAEEGWAEAERLAEAAAEREPDWSLPYALIAFARFQAAMRGFSAKDARTAFSATLEAARRALAVDPGSWLAHALTGVGELWTNRRHDVALDHVHRALELNPSAVWTHHFGGCVAGFAGDPAAARRHQGRICRVDPAYPYAAVIEADLGLWRLLEGDLDAAETHLDAAERRDPRYGRALQRRVALCGLRGDRPGARRAMARLEAIGAPLGREQIVASYPFREAAHREIFFEGFRRAGVNL